MNGRSFSTGTSTSPYSSLTSVEASMASAALKPTTSPVESRLSGT
jgi:hypothetical protein